MDVANILKPDSVRCESGVRSQKHALELLSDILESIQENLNAAEILEGLVNRERLGSTALGHSIAMPHARLNGLDRSIGAFLKLDAGVDFDSPDGEPVDLLFGVLVPQDCTDEQIREMKELIQRLNDSALQLQLRETTDPAELYDLLTDSLTVIHRRLNA